jgi:hypothetical protein
MNDSAIVVVVVVVVVVANGVIDIDVVPDVDFVFVSSHAVQDGHDGVVNVVDIIGDADISIGKHKRSLLLVSARIVWLVRRVVPNANSWYVAPNAPCFYEYNPKWEQFRANNNLTLG